jgi:hypothetical protein
MVIDLWAEFPLTLTNSSRLRRIQDDYAQTENTSHVLWLQTD